MHAQVKEYDHCLAVKNKLNFQVKGSVLTKWENLVLKTLKR